MGQGGLHWGRSHFGSEWSEAGSLDIAADEYDGIGGTIFSGDNFELDCDPTVGCGVPGQSHEFIDQATEFGVIDYPIGTERAYEFGTERAYEFGTERAYEFGTESIVSRIKGWWANRQAAKAAAIVAAARAANPPRATGNIMQQARASGDPYALGQSLTGGVGGGALTLAGGE
jgi:hypothetical protein